MELVGVTPLSGVSFIYRMYRNIIIQNIRARENTAGAIPVSRTKSVLAQQIDGLIINESKSWCDV